MFTNNEKLIEKIHLSSFAIFQMFTDYFRIVIARQQVVTDRQHRSNKFM